MNRVPTLGGPDLDVYAVDGGGLLAHRATVPAAEGVEEIPELSMPFNGYLVPAKIVIAEVNGIIERQPMLRAEPYVMGSCRWVISLNGEVVYSSAARNAQEALLAAGGTFVALVNQMTAHGLRWWDEESYRGRPVWYGGVAAVVASRDDEGHVLLVLDAPQPELKPPVEGPPSLWVDILDPSIDWARTRPAEGTADHTVMVGSSDGRADEATADATEEETTDGGRGERGDEDVPSV
jgi:hypothetical protein